MDHLIKGKSPLYLPVGRQGKGGRGGFEKKNPP